MNVLTDLRTDRGYSMKALGEKAGITQTTIYRLEHGQKGSLLTLKKLAKALGVDLTELNELSDNEIEIMALSFKPATIETGGTYRPDPDELTDLLEVVARSQRDGPGAHISINHAIEAIKKQNAEFLAARKHGQQKQISA